MLGGRLPPASMFPAGASDVTARFVTLRSGLRVRTLECGPADGAPVFLVHGWACSVYSFRHNFAPLAAAGFRVLSADLKGHGLSDKPTAAGEYTVEAMVAHLGDILDALGVGRAALVGHSLGGALALDVAMRFPERVSRIALLDSVGLGRSGLVSLVRLLTPRAVAPLLPRLTRRWMVSLVLRVAYGGRGSFSGRDVDEYWAPSQFPESVLAARAMAHEFSWTPQPLERLRTLYAPTLVLFGTRDRLVNFGATAQLVKQLPNGRLHLVRGAGHVTPEEAPEEVNRVLRDFLVPDLGAGASPRIGVA